MRAETLIEAISDKDEGAILQDAKWIGIYGKELNAILEDGV
jgi:hypothetical protein